MEVSPAYDHAELTGIAAAHVVYELVSLHAAGINSGTASPAYGEADITYGK